MSDLRTVLQVPSRFSIHKLRFAFRWHSALLKRCRPRGQSARRTRRLPHERAPWAQAAWNGIFSPDRLPTTFGRLAPADFWAQRGLSKGNSEKPRSYAARVDSSENENVSLLRLYLFRVASSNRRANMTCAVTSRSGCDLCLTASMESAV